MLLSRQMSYFLIAFDFDEDGLSVGLLTLIRELIRSDCLCQVLN